MEDAKWPAKHLVDKTCAGQVDVMKRVDRRHTVHAGLHVSGCLGSVRSDVPGCIFDVIKHVGLDTTPDSGPVGVSPRVPGRHIWHMHIFSWKGPNVTQNVEG
jgi:hypothetical protein